MKNILFITGTRADFGKLKPLMHKVEKDPDFTCSIFATGMHLLKKYGNTLIEIKKEGFKNIFTYFNQTNNTNCFSDVSLAETIKGLSFYLSENSIDLLVVHGDRIETLAGAIVGALRGVRTAHIEGGERSGTVDELIRHAVSKLAHIHFVSREKNKLRLIQMGEKKDSIFVIGSPDIDVMLSDTLPSIDSVKSYYGINFSDYSIFIYHPVTNELDRLKHNISEVIAALIKSNKNYIVIKPNNDAGSHHIIDALQSINDLSNFKIFPSIRFEFFLTLLRHAQYIVGNSSCGIHEAPIYGVPTINIGTRQSGRFDSPSIYNVIEDQDKIINIIKILPPRCNPVFNYGKGNSAEMFITELHKKNIWQIPLQKSFQDLL